MYTDLSSICKFSPRNSFSDYLKIAVLVNVTRAEKKTTGGSL